MVVDGGERIHIVPNLRQSNRYRILEEYRIFSSFRSQTTHTHICLSNNCRGTGGFRAPRDVLDEIGSGFFIERNDPRQGRFDCQSPRNGNRALTGEDHLYKHTQRSRFAILRCSEASLDFGGDAKHHNRRFVDHTKLIWRGCEHAEMIDSRRCF